METTTLQRSGDVYTDIHGLQNLKRNADNPSEETLRAVARQFESMLVNMMMKSMRDANAVFEEDSPFQSQEGKFFRDMHDQQMSLTLSQQGGLGLADTLVRQLSKSLPKTLKEGDGAVGPALAGHDSSFANNAATAAPTANYAERIVEAAAPTQIPVGPALAGQATSRTDRAPEGAPTLDSGVGPGLAGQGRDRTDRAAKAATTAPNQVLNAVETAPTTAPAGEEQGFLPEALQRIDQMVSAVSSFRSPADFVAKLLPLAEHAASELGASPKALLAQAALETGWGKHIIGDAKDSSFNLFNIKADRRWEGDSKAVKTLEFKGGVAEQVRDRFRSYGSFAESFQDYVSFLKQNPRYSNALEKAGDAEAFVSELHQAGYATDPAYSSKIRQIMNSDLFKQAMDGVKSFADLPISNRGGSAW